MQPMIHVFLCDDAGERFFGEGPYRLLKKVDECGSLRQAAMNMGMAYTKALKLVRRAEDRLGFRLIECRTGGQRGGGSVVTGRGKELLSQYESYKNACREANRRIFAECFPAEPEASSDPDRQPGER